MDLNRIVRLVGNMLRRSLVNIGLRKGLALLGRRDGRAGRAVTPGDARALAKKARKAARITRRLGR